MSIKDLVYDGVKKISEAIKVNPNIGKLFEKLPNGKLNISLTFKDFRTSSILISHFELEIDFIIIKEREWEVHGELFM